MKDLIPPDVQAGLADSQHPLDSRAAMPPWLRGVVGAIALYLFISSVVMMGIGLKIVGEDKLKWLFDLVDDPITGLFVGVLFTAIVQSSSFTTSMTVTAVSTGQLTLPHAMPIIMGANIGTSITGLLVSMGHLRRRNEFRRSLSAASCHDFFNVLCVVLFLPLEVKFRIVSGPVVKLADMLTNMGLSPGVSKTGPIKMGISAIGNLFKWLLGDVMNVPATWAGAVIAILAMVLLFSALWMLVKTLRSLMQSRLSTVFDKTLFRNPGTAFVVGIVMTAAIQSSSVTISMVVPLVGADILQLSQVFPYMLGANIGTTVTALLAALSLGSPQAIACACGHLLFNSYGTIVFWPLQVIPVGLAKAFGEIAARRRLVAISFILALFFLLPISALLIMKWIGQIQ